MKEVNKIIKNKKKLNHIRKEKGITLLAMVITIIVLLILAGIVIRMITSDDGVINKASNARNTYEKAGKDENTALSNYSNSIKQELDKIKKPISKSESFVGHYVSLNGTSIDGIIFADLAVGGSGEQNTAEMLKRWNSGYYGEKDIGHESGRDDIWGKIGDKVKEGWFVPSKEEFAAYTGEVFSYEVEHSTICCGEKSQLSSHIWTSSQKDDSNVWVARYGGNCIGTGRTSYGYYLRLAIRV